ncbi:hypothetical protein V496_00046 [Pseudogymnoascus sp. VKM F-4515 (FW-2607)]|nr:hypothetical protein V496_00046 [Pseudogymnoascus sp. VKM F-4515 (FW-2607)]
MARMPEAALVPLKIPPNIPHVRASKRKGDGDRSPTANTSFPTTSSVDTHNTGADESHEGSNEEIQAREPHSFYCYLQLGQSFPA